MAKITTFRPRRMVDGDDDIRNISRAEVDLLLRWRQLPRPMQMALHAFVRAAAARTTSLAALPILVNIDQVANIYHLTVKTLQRKCSDGAFSPLPARKYPYLWRRDDIVRDIHGPTPRFPKRAHGFAAMKARRMRAAAEQEETV